MFTHELTVDDLHNKYDPGLIGHPAVATWTDLSMLSVVAKTISSATSETKLTESKRNAWMDRRGRQNNVHTRVPHLTISLPFHDLTQRPQHDVVLSPRGYSHHTNQTPSVDLHVLKRLLQKKKSHLKRTSALKMSYLGLCRI